MLYLEMIARERQNILMEEANRIRRRKALRREKPVRRNILAERLGDLLIGLGQRLKKRHAPRPEIKFL